jgi:uncharacterized protein YgiM (DUF1202 family)
MTIIRTRFVTLSLLIVALLILAGCGSAQPTEVAQEIKPTLHPTFTPTPTQDIGVPEPTLPPTPTGQPTTAPEETSPTPTPEPPTPTPEPPTPTPPPPQVKVVAQSVNVRSGPGTNYPRVGTARQGQTFDILAKNQKGTWFQITFNGKTAWIVNDPKLTNASGDMNSVAVAENIPTPPPTPRPRPTSPPPPTPTPAPSYLFVRLSMDQRPNTNPIVTFFGGLYNRNLDLGAPVTGYTMVAIAPNGERREAPFTSPFQFGDPGLPSEFVYNAKIEFPLIEGTYRVYVADGGGNQVSEVWEATVSGETRTFLPRWKEK